MGGWVGGWGRVKTKLFRLVKIIDNAGWPLNRSFDFFHLAHILEVCWGESA